MFKNSSKLSFVSLGPGDLELITLKALNALRECDVICVPTKSENLSFTKSITHSMVEEILAFLKIEKKIIPVYSPMKFKQEDWINEANVLLNSCKIYKNVCFVTLGDASVYSSVYYILNIIKEKNLKIYENSEVIAGVTSFSAASARVKKALCLGDEALIIKPINPRKELVYTEILMRPKIGMDTSSLGKGDFYTFENMYLQDEKISSKKIKIVKKYMTLFINFVQRKNLKY